MNSIDKLIQNRLGSAEQSRDMAVQSAHSSPKLNSQADDRDKEGQSTSSDTESRRCSDSHHSVSAPSAMATTVSTAASSPTETHTMKPLESPIKLVDGILPKPAKLLDEANSSFMRIPGLTRGNWAVNKDAPVLPKISADTAHRAETS